MVLLLTDGRKQGPWLFLSILNPIHKLQRIVNWAGNWLQKNFIFQLFFLETDDVLDTAGTRPLREAQIYTFFLRILKGSHQSPTIVNWV